MLPRDGGGHLPLHLAAHLHPRAATRHDRHRVLANALPHRAAHQLAAAAQGAAAGGGELPVGAGAGEGAACGSGSRQGQGAAGPHGPVCEPAPSAKPASAEPLDCRLSFPSK